MSSWPSANGAKLPIRRPQPRSRIIQCPRIAMSSVDDIWAALKKGGLPTASSGARRSSNPLAGLHGIPGITSSVRTYDKSRGPSAAAEQKRPGFIEQLGQGAAGPGGETQAGADQQASLVSCRRCRRPGPLL